MSALAIVGAVVTLLSTLGAIFVSLWGAKVQARSTANKERTGDQAATNKTIEIGHEVLIDGIKWSQTQLNELRTENSQLTADLREAKDKQYTAERRVLRVEREKGVLETQNDELREQLTEALRAQSGTKEQPANE